MRWIRLTVHNIRYLCSRQIRSLTEPSTLGFDEVSQIAMLGEVHDNICKCAQWWERCSLNASTYISPGLA